MESYLIYFILFFLKIILTGTLKMASSDTIDNKMDKESGNDAIVNTGNYKIHRLRTYPDYKKWIQSIKLALTSIGALDMIEADYVPPTIGDFEMLIRQKNKLALIQVVSPLLVRELQTGEDKKRVTAMMMINQSVASNINTTLENCASVYEMWQKIATHFESSDNYQQNLLKQEENLPGMLFKQNSAKKEFYETMSTCLDRYTEKWSQMKHQNIEPTPNEKANRIKDILWNIHHNKALEISEKLENGGIYNDEEINKFIKFIRNYDFNKMNRPPYHDLIVKGSGKETNLIRSKDGAPHYQNGNGKSTHNKDGPCDVCKKNRFRNACFTCNLCGGHGHSTKNCSSRVDDDKYCDRDSYRYHDKRGHEVNDKAKNDKDKNGNGRHNYDVKRGDSRYKGRGRSNSRDRYRHRSMSPHFRGRSRDRTDRKEYHKPRFSRSRTPTKIDTTAPLNAETNNITVVNKDDDYIYFGNFDDVDKSGFE